MKTKTLIATVIASFVSLTLGCSFNQGGGGTPSGTVVAGLRSFENCSDLSGFLAGEEDEGDGFSSPLGRPTVGTPLQPGEPSGTGGEDTASEESSASDAPTSAPVEVTVEEADLVKRDGNRLYVANASSGLLIYDVSTPSAMHRAGQLDLPGLQPVEMQIAGDKILLISTTGASRTKVSAINVSDPASPVILKGWEFAGAYSESRKVGSAVYLVLQKWVGGTEKAIAAQLKEKNPCDRVYVPEDLKGGASSFNSWDLIGLSLSDLDREPAQVSLIGSVTSSVYATPEHLYLTNHVFEDDMTGVYLLSLSPSTADIAPVAKAKVPGSIVNQFSMDETDGIFRIASSTGSLKNYITTFRVGEDLAKLGQIDTIAPGETITAARFLGKRAFVTTVVEFKDPLVSVDLSNPAAPKVKANIDLPGRPGYIHVWNDLLMTVGWGDGWDAGVSLSLFDITDADHPVLVEQETVPNASYSEAQADHRAFGFFEDRAVLAIPVVGGASSQVVFYRVQQTGFAALGAIAHDDLFDGTADEGYSPTLRRALEVGDVVVTVSEAGIKATGFDDLTEDLFGEVFPGFEVSDDGFSF